MQTKATPAQSEAPKATAIATPASTTTNPFQVMASEEEEAVQMKAPGTQLPPGYTRNPLQMKQPTSNPFAPKPSTQNPLQLKTSTQNPLQPITYSNPFQRKAAPAAEQQQPNKENNTALPDNLKAGVEALSGYSMDDVKVHYNSDKPAQLQALAYAQGTDIHIAPGQEQHLPHEAWHVVQQKQGRVQSTMQMKQGIAVNNDERLEHEADVMGVRALEPINQQRSVTYENVHSHVVQCVMLDKDELVNKQLKPIIKRGVRPKNKAEEKPFIKALIDNDLIHMDKTLPLIDQEIDKITLTALTDKNLGVYVAETLSLNNAQWDEFKTLIDTNNANEHNSERIVDTKIQWQEAEEDMGTGVVAFLTPDHPLGTTPGGEGSEITNTFNEAYDTDYIAGHILNSKLGGPGTDKRNIAPMPADANSQFSSGVEDKVIEKVNILGQILKYKVNIKYFTPPKQTPYITEIFGSISTFSTDLKTINENTLPANEFAFSIPVKPPQKKSNTLAYAETIDKLPESAKSADFKPNNIVLGDAKQLKLEYISHVIHFLQISELQKEKEKLIAEKEINKDLIETLDEKLLAANKTIKSLTSEIETLKKQIEKEQASNKQELINQATENEKLLNDSEIALQKLQKELNNALNEKRVYAKDYGINRRRQGLPLDENQLTPISGANAKKGYDEEDMNIKKGDNREIEQDKRDIEQDKRDIEQDERDVKFIEQQIQFSKTTRKGVKDGTILNNELNEKQNLISIKRKELVEKKRKLEERIKGPEQEKPKYSPASFMSPLPTNRNNNNSNKGNNIQS